MDAMSSIGCGGGGARGWCAAPVALLTPLRQSVPHAVHSSSAATPSTCDADGRGDDEDALTWRRAATPSSPPRIVAAAPPLVAVADWTPPRAAVAAADVSGLRDPPAIKRSRLASIADLSLGSEAAAAPAPAPAEGMDVPAAAAAEWSDVARSPSPSDERRRRRRAPPPCLCGASVAPWPRSPHTVWCAALCGAAAHTACVHHAPDADGSALVWYCAVCTVAALVPPTERVVSVLACRPLRQADDGAGAAAEVVLPCDPTEAAARGLRVRVGVVTPTAVPRGPQRHGALRASAAWPLAGVELSIAGGRRRVWEALARDDGGLVVDATAQVCTALADCLGQFRASDGGVALALEVRALLRPPLDAARRPFAEGGATVVLVLTAPCAPHAWTRHLAAARTLNPHVVDGVRRCLPMPPPPPPRRRGDEAAAAGGDDADVARGRKRRRRGTDAAAAAAAAAQALRCEPPPPSVVRALARALAAVFAADAAAATVGIHSQCTCPLTAGCDANGVPPVLVPDVRAAMARATEWSGTDCPRCGGPRAPSFLAVLRGGRGRGSVSAWTAGTPLPSWAQGLGMLRRAPLRRVGALASGCFAHEAAPAPLVAPRLCPH
jgi:hypothetical protein